ncbi:AbfB domain-containing protein [Frankia sp. R82]|uniref:AbfB domain-containing protein n=1 Tax=Frankia sp. R82 TaxID=2950553 RepID=UPI002042F5A8|nr:AbfB domain-containing protein [Frankia sp. R82]MCM3884882.1 AbfB domain-containing protein [Frankia sp. R82]
MSENFQSFNVPDRYIRHRDFAGELTPRGEPIEDFAFTLLSRGQGRVTFRSQNFPDRVLRHRDFQIWLDPVPHTSDTLFAADSTFLVVAGRADQSAVSFRSVNYPDRYLRHRDFRLWVEAPTGPADALFHRDATFRRRPATVAIDPGTVLVPADD